MSETRYIAATSVAYALQQIKRELVDILLEDEINHANINATFDGWFKQLDLRPSDSLVKDPTAEWRPEGRVM